MQGNVKTIIAKTNKQQTPQITTAKQNKIKETKQKKNKHWDPDR